MSNATAQRASLGEAQAAPTEGHKFFDPQSPEAPDQILGVDTNAIVRLGRSAVALDGLPYEVSLGLHVLPDAVRIYPLIERMQSGEELKPEDVRPYRGSIKRLSPELRMADNLAKLTTPLGVGVALRRAINRRIEREFPARAATMMDQAREKIGSIEENVDLLAKFENPKEEFVSELSVIAGKTKEAIREEKEIRIRTQVEPERLPPPRSIFGFFTRVVRKIRSFFGIFSWKKNVVENPEVTAYDAAGGIERTMNELLNNKDNTRQTLPMLSHLLDRLPINKLPSREQLAFLAPEVLTSIFSALPKTQENDELLESVKRNPHEFRFLTRYKKTFRGYSLLRAQRATISLLPAIRDALPSDGTKIRQVFESAKDLLQPLQVDSTKETVKQADVESRSMQKRGIRRLLRRKKSSK